MCAGCGWVCRGCVAGVLAGCVAGVAGVCRRSVRAAGWKPRGPRVPPPSPRPLRRVVPYFVCDVPRTAGVGWVCRGCAGAARLLRRVSSTRVVRLPLPADCPRGLPLFRVLRLALPSPSPRELMFASPGTSSSSVPRGFKDTQRQRHARQARGCFSPCAPHVAFLFAVAVLRSTRNSNFHPPAKNTPPTLGDPAHGPEWMSGVHLGVSGGRGLPRVCLRVFHGVPDRAAPRRRQQAPCTPLPIKARCVSAVAHGRRRRPRV